MAALFKYLRTDFAEEFQRRGKLLFRPLSYFRAIEDGAIRGDGKEGHYSHRPKGGLQINNLTRGESFVSDFSFNSEVRYDDIFIYCLSSAFNPDLARKFEAESCVEIVDVRKFIRRIRVALSRLPGQDRRIVSSFVNYDADAVPPGIHWALPDQIILRKHSIYAEQKEFRIGFCQNGAFDVENVNLTLTTEDKLQPRPSAGKDVMRFLELGELRDITKMHTF